MKSAEFRKELTRIMPGYKWTIHRQGVFDKITLSAIGIQSSGFNRTSTLSVVRREKDGNAEYDVSSSGHGCRSPWLGEYTDGTLARALRGLQDEYERAARNYANHASALEYGRKAE